MDSIALPAASLLVAVGVQVLCQLFKFVVYSIRDHRVSPHYLVTAGGMPSAHSAFVTALTTAVGLRAGIDSEIFAVAFVFAAIVAYDAYRLRGHVQEHARWINRLQARVESRSEVSEAGQVEATQSEAAGRAGRQGVHRSRAADNAGEIQSGRPGELRPHAGYPPQAELRPRADNARATGDVELRPQVVSEMVGHTIGEIVAGIAFGVFGAVAVSAVFL